MSQISCIRSNSLLLENRLFHVPQPTISHLEGSNRAQPEVSFLINNVHEQRQRRAIAIAAAMIANYDCDLDPNHSRCERLLSAIARGEEEEDRGIYIYICIYSIEGQRETPRAGGRYVCSVASVVTPFLRAHTRALQVTRRPIEWRRTLRLPESGMFFSLARGASKCFIT